MSEMESKFHQRLVYVRDCLLLTQEEVAKRCGMDKTLICHYEKGRREPSISNLERLCKGLKVSADYLMGLKDLDPVEVISDFKINGKHFGVIEL